MFARTLAAWCVVAVGAHCLALEVPTNYFIGAGNIPVGESIDVRGNARLTIDFSQESFESIADINLWDEATLIVRSGRVTGEIRVHGDNRLDLRSGRFGQRVTGDGDAQITIRGGQFSGQWSFTGGSQRISMTGGRGVGLRGDSIALDFHSRYPLYSLDPTRAILAGFSSTTPTISDSTASASEGVRWRMHSTRFNPADSNRDGVIDILDLNVVRNAFGRPAVDLLTSYLGETLPYDGRVDVQDLNRVRSAFGTTSPNVLLTLERETLAQTAVPEPATLALMTATLTPTFLFWGKRRITRWWRSDMSRIASPTARILTGLSPGSPSMTKPSN